MLVEIDNTHGYHLAALVVVIHLLFRVEFAVLEIDLKAFGDHTVDLVEIFEQVKRRYGSAVQRYAADKISHLRVGAHTLEFVYQPLFLLRGKEFVDRYRINHKSYLVERETLVYKAVKRGVVRPVYPADIVPRSA